MCCGTDNSSTILSLHFNLFTVITMQIDNSSGDRLSCQSRKVNCIDFPAIVIEFTVMHIDPFVRLWENVLRTENLSVPEIKQKWHLLSDTALNHKECWRIRNV